MAMSWGTALGSMDDSLESLMARRRLENNGLLQIAQTQDQFKTSQMNRDTLTEQRGAMADFRQAAAKKMETDAAAAKREEDEELKSKAQVEAMLADPNAEAKYGKQVMDAIKLQYYAKVKPSISLTERPDDDKIVDTYKFDKDGKPVVTGTVKKGSVAYRDPAEGGNARPYFIPVTTANGIEIMDGRTGTFTGGRAPLPPTADQRNRHTGRKAAQPVIDSINELSERINTQQGLYAKITGEAEKLAAKANMDDDVAEYMSLLSGFTPLVARAVGHTGVLTQADVDSVREMFPKPGDSKSLRDRKVARLIKIMDASSEALATPGMGVTETTGVKTPGVTAKPAAAPAAATPGPLSYADYLKSRGKK
jgi:hypothetical protein